MIAMFCKCGCMTAKTSIAPRVYHIPDARSRIAAFRDVGEARRRAAERTQATAPVDLREVRTRRLEPSLQHGAQCRIREEGHRLGVETARGFHAAVAEPVASWQQRVGADRAHVP